MNNKKELINLEGLTIISLFDGMSGGQQAIKNLGIKDNYNYISSEIDKYAMAVTRYNFPKTKFVGSVVNLTIEKANNTNIILNKKYIVDAKKIILIGGSPCQGFSFVGKQKGASTKCNIEITTLKQYEKLKQEEFAFEGQSYLFWEYIRIKTELEKYNKKLIFLLENVKMQNKWKEIFNKEMGVKPILINSKLVSAQMRPRYYWSNKGEKIIQPNDKNIFLQDILENEVEEKYYLSEKAINYINKEERITKKLTAINGDKALCLMSQYNHSKNGTFLCVDGNGRIDDKKTGALTQRYYKGTENYGSNPFILNYKDMKYRKFTPLECERLQTVEDNYTAKGLNEEYKEVKISDTQRYKMIGNGWTISVITHILKELNILKLINI